MPLLTEQQFMPTVLDTMSSMCLSPELTDGLMSKGIKLLSSVTPSNLPLLIRFLCQFASKSNSPKIVKAFRGNIDLANIRDQLLSQHGPVKSASTGISILVDTLRTSIRMQDTLASAWLKELQSTEQNETASSSSSVAEGSGSATERKSTLGLLDVWMLLLLCSIPKHQKAAELVLREKLQFGPCVRAIPSTPFLVQLAAVSWFPRAGVLAVSFFCQAVLEHEKGLTPIFATLLNIADTFIRRSSRDVLMQAGSQLLEVLFAAFPSSNERQQVSLFRHRPSRFYCFPHPSGGGDGSVSHHQRARQYCRRSARRFAEHGVRDRHFSCRALRISCCCSCSCDWSVDGGPETVSASHQFPSLPAPTAGSPSLLFSSLLFPSALLLGFPFRSVPFRSIDFSFSFCLLFWLWMNEWQDYVADLEIPQLRKLFTVLCLLEAAEDPRGGKHNHTPFVASFSLPYLFSYLLSASSEADGSEDQPVHRGAGAGAVPLSQRSSPPSSGSSVSSTSSGTAHIKSCHTNR